MVVIAMVALLAEAVALPVLVAIIVVLQGALAVLVR
jgi:hypothetical protein